jgi:peptide/nickel transport system substrate-binding protein
MKYLKTFAIGLVAASWFAQSPIAQAVDRKDQVVFELPKVVEDPANFNWYFRAPNGEARRENGAQQAMWEPLFLFNYETGNLDPWLAAEAMKPDASFTNWTLKLRPNIEWSDSAAAAPQHFTANDVKFTADLMLGKVDNNKDFKPTALEAVNFISQVVDVSVVNDLTVSFKLRNPNPRFPLETFGGTMFSSFLILPKHIWGGDSPRVCPRTSRLNA